MLSCRRRTAYATLWRQLNLTVPCLLAPYIECRFTDVKSMLIQQYESLKQQHKELTVQEPEILQLDVNYRSHAGILDVANAIVGAMRDFSPLTIDRYDQHSLPAWTYVLKSSGCDHAAGHYHVLAVASHQDGACNLPVTTVLTAAHRVLCLQAAS